MTNAQSTSSPGATPSSTTEKSPLATAAPSPTPTVRSHEGMVKLSAHPSKHVRRSWSAEEAEFKRGEVPEDLVGAVQGDTSYKVAFSGPDDPRSAQNWR